jgi:hypothetical protein
MSNANLNAAARNVRSIDRIWSKSSAMERIGKRAAALEMLPETRGAAYSLAWMVDTGRLDTSGVSALLTMSARDFAAAALRIAADGGCVNDAADAWSLAARLAA